MIIHGKAYAITLGARKAPIAEPAFRIVDIGHKLAAAAVGFTSAVVVQLAFNTVE